jgi:hypothetical protein
VALEVKEIATPDIKEPLEAMGLEKEKKGERKEEKRSRAGPGTIIYPDRVPVPASISIPATATVPATSVAAAGRRSLVIITGNAMQRNRGENLPSLPMHAHAYDLSYIISSSFVFIFLLLLLFVFLFSSSRNR